VKVSDFGTARLLTREEHPARHVSRASFRSDVDGSFSGVHLTTAQGTLAWMAPEVLADQAYGAAADGAVFVVFFFIFFLQLLSFYIFYGILWPKHAPAVYSFGIVMHEILVRVLP